MRAYGPFPSAHNRPTCSGQSHQPDSRLPRRQRTPTRIRLPTSVCHRLAKQPHFPVSTPDVISTTAKPRLGNYREHRSIGGVAVALRWSLPSSRQPSTWMKWGKEPQTPAPPPHVHPRYEPPWWRRTKTGESLIIHRLKMGAGQQVTIKKERYALGTRCCAPDWPTVLT
jgi:hypothetical protein